LTPKGIPVSRNPDDAPKTISLDVGEVLGLTKCKVPMGDHAHQPVLAAMRGALLNGDRAIVGA
jgi:hypothetical protein